MAEPKLEVTVLRATDLKNVEKKGKSDPYAVLELAGTEFKTKVIKNNLNPQWDETFKFTLPAPLSANSPALNITVKDKERTRDRLLGKCTVRLDVLMGDRTQTKFYSLSQGEGRIQLRLKYDGPVDSSAPAAPQAGTATCLMRRCRIRVEASIGNIGNVLENPDTEGSITAPAKPTFDGSCYYYISWENRKPCLELKSDWEDIDYRYKTLNFLRTLAASLEDICHQIAVFQSQRDIEEDALLDLTDDAILALETFQKLCQQPLPALPDGKFTRLDYHLFRLRNASIRTFNAMAGTMIKKIKELGAMKILDICGEDVPDLRGQVMDMCYEPQLSIPDVILWILTDDQRRAYLRVPVSDIMFDENPAHRGKQFGQVQTAFMKLPAANRSKANQTGDIPAQIQFRAWFGDAEYTALWPKSPATLAVLSEVYENQRYMLTKWADPGIGRYTDVTRKKKQPKDQVLLPTGWEWTSEWEIAPEIVEFDPEAAVDAVTEEVWENQRLIPFKGWRNPTSHPSFSALNPREKADKDSWELDEGWAWEGDWEVDTARPCDHEGWAYAVSFASKTFFPAKKRIHCVRRRRWTRTRRRIARVQNRDGDTGEADADADADEEDEADPLMEGDPEGWLYAFSFGSQFHKKRRRRDLVRSRRFHRERQPIPGFDFAEVAPLTPEEQEQTYSVGLFYRYPKLELYQVRAHIYQARKLIAEDASGLSDPYVYLICGHHSTRSTTVKQSTCPLFDQVGTHEIQHVMNYAHFPEPKDPALAAITRNTVIAISEGDRASVFNKKDEDAKSILQEAKKQDPDFTEDEIDWWTKFYASMQQSEAIKRYRGNVFTIYKWELERVFDLEDVVSSFSLVRGKTGQQRESGMFKGKIHVITDVDEVPPGSTFDREAQTDVTRVLVRVYIVRGEDFQPQDANGGCDSYIQIHLGNKRVVNDVSNYIPDALSPVFGKTFEVEAVIPLQTELRVSVWDQDTLDKDDLVGATTIDLEDRWLSKCRPRCGLPQTYTREGFNAWRDAHTPREILSELCEEHDLPEPLYSDDPNNVWVKTALPERGIETFTCQYLEPDNDMEIKLENAALSALHSMDWTPEHIETRRLYNDCQPGVEQGRLKMWIDMFPLDGPPIPPPIDISPRKPKEYELRVVVYNTYDVVLDEKSITGERMSDIYVSGLLRGMESKKAKTDTHYRSLNGEGNFNWRLKFKFLYYPAEEKLVFHKKRSLLSRDKEEIKVPPILALQVWDNDLFSADDFLAAIDLNLLEMPAPFKLPKKCKMYTQEYHDKHERINLFKAKRVAGVYPCTRGGGEKGEELTGKLEVEIELLTAEEAEQKDNGFGRKEPNQFPKLKKPNRPPTSFFWLTSPWKTFRYIIWKNYKWYFLLALLISGLITFLCLMFYNVPRFSVGAIFGSKA
ncbi:hypothetical protein PTSG_10792 [Salpingoeca rosetta]|uniref:C2 domain-containing protein n=1 Tax=Salpingoeca rosetta (strain ATCC 50818 / BSB-021) TaxID=946362 RepID=F2UPX9_SALR5|nr:uncharacterized protein PTSG_10792 [Salpingoeca rosetta]EGD79809.1 hypothetical protein PTSG_10792 [Salpingoeca rosetta]|eukprot:XP_004988758.1 hypothetical protein PTSG_10792 [Salpingoeca rosetta]